jgi:hypothetical protein
MMRIAQIAPASLPALQAKDAQRRALRQVRDDLFRLFGEKDGQRRGKARGGVLNRLFQASGILVREAFILAFPWHGSHRIG